VNVPPANDDRSGNPFHKQLGKMTYFQACHWLGEQGAELIAQGGHAFEIDPEDVYLGADLYRARVHDRTLPGGVAVATVLPSSGETQAGHSEEDASKGLLYQCDPCGGPCVHLGAALGYLLDARSTMGLAESPDESVPLENLTHGELRRRAMAERLKRATEEPMRVRSRQPDRPWTEYTVTNAISNRTYRVALCGPEPGQSYCSCPDFRTNYLGTCKHILHVLEKARERFSAADLRTLYVRQQVALAVHYGRRRGLRFYLPSRRDRRVAEIVEPYTEETLVDAGEGLRRVEQLRRLRIPVQIYPDAEEWMQRQLVHQRVRKAVEGIRRGLADHPLRSQLLKADLLPYQLEGIAFAASAGRAILADDLGLGKNLQAIGTAELLARLAEIQRVLIVCPALSRSQWQEEIAGSCERTVQSVMGDGRSRASLYGRAFFTICSYEQVLRDQAVIEATRWDLIVLDEGQRIRNWESKISRAIRALSSHYALVLVDNPLENRLDELFTVAQFVDEALLGPAHEFFHRHRVVDERGQVVGYRRLEELRELLRPVMLRRTRESVADQLPLRTDELLRVRPTAEQLELHSIQLRILAELLGKQLLTQLDLLRLRGALMDARMAVNSTYLVDKQEPEYSSKLDRLSELLGTLAEDPARIIAVFSEWPQMLPRIQRVLERLRIPFQDLDAPPPGDSSGSDSTPAVDAPAAAAAPRVFLVSSPVGAAEELQRVNTVIHLDVPWTAAVLDQRLARVQGQDSPRSLHVFRLVAEGSLEERIHDTWARTADLSSVIADWNAEIPDAELPREAERLRRRLGSILPDVREGRLAEESADRLDAHVPASPALPASPAPVSASAPASAGESLSDERLALAGGQLLAASLRWTAELLRPARAASPQQVDAWVQRLREHLDRDGQQRPTLRVTLSDDETLRLLAAVLASWGEP
jgi:hypothetical protein